MGMMESVIGIKTFLLSNSKYAVHSMLLCSLSIYLIVCMDAWNVLCPDVPKVKYDIGTIEVLNTKNLKNYKILPELNWKYQVFLYLIIELSASHWLVTPNDILNLINWIEGLKWLDYVLLRCPLRKYYIWHLSVLNSKKWKDDWFWSE